MGEQPAPLLEVVPAVLTADPALPPSAPPSPHRCAAVPDDEDPALMSFGAFPASDFVDAHDADAAWLGVFEPL